MLILRRRRWKRYSKTTLLRYWWNLLGDCREELDEYRMELLILVRPTTSKREMRKKKEERDWKNRDKHLLEILSL